MHFQYENYIKTCLAIITNDAGSLLQSIFKMDYGNSLPKFYFDRCNLCYL